MNNVRHPLTPLRFILIYFAIFVVLALLQRFVFIGWILAESQKVTYEILPAFFKGLVFDLIVASILFAPLIAFTIIASTLKRTNKTLRSLMSFFAAFPLIFTIVMLGFEFFFFNEFHARFNFIAVDYLVYTHEVIRNIWESYPVVWFFLGMFLLSLPIIYLTRRLIARLDFSAHASLRIAPLIAIIILPLVLLVFSEDRFINNEAYWPREIAKNSFFTLFAAYFKNSIDFHEFYTSMDSTEARVVTHRWLQEKDVEAAPSIKAESTGEDPHALVRNIETGQSEKDWNVIVVVIESLSARYLEHYGHKGKLTPNLDRMADEGMFFNNLYATGTRTVRGLEAILLSVPPTPGQSILRRPNSDGIFNLGTVFSRKGYHTQFLYGGYSYFDNMKEWFSGNGYEIVDRANLADNEIQFANAWGVCDEDLFASVIKQADILTKEKKKFFQVVLTTSNHRPYSYPDNKIDIPSLSGRDGAVKYTDYAIGQFVEKAKTHEWYKNTLFVFIADHNAAVAGGTDIPIRDYLIPVIFYNPELIKNQTINKLSSQIDFAPTLLGLMDFSYQSHFYGQNLLKAKAGRALMGTYQKVALMEPGKMVVLSPNQQLEVLTLSPTGEVTNTQVLKARKGAVLSPDMKKVVAIYQSASEMFSEGESKVSREYPKHINVREY